MSDNSSSSSGIGVTGLLGVAFVIMKLCKVINWSWWWVTCPFWAGGVIVLIGLIGLWVAILYKNNDERKRIESGLNPWAWENKKRLRKNLPQRPELKSKWQQRLDEMKESKK